MNTPSRRGKPGMCSPSMVTALAPVPRNRGIFLLTNFPNLVKMFTSNQFWYNLYLIMSFAKTCLSNGGYADANMVTVME